ncbi:MAG: exodeoxyribonuclease I [Phycisphaerae bacterium]|nr:exodeoxyribonuclease I [Phycisphaerae bacterium]OUX00398.1 MAG: exodeoxyribonuclease I [Phycisphaeraceae bacterium TMED231]
MQDETILWFDFETFGSLPRPWDGGRSGPYPRRDRPSQFGAIRTTLDLEEVGEPIELHCRPSVEEPPSIGACLVTGILPQDTTAGLEEARFIESVLEVLSVPGTTSTGWNSLGYDDEIVRFTAWRNLLPPYEREYKRDNARFDLLVAFRFAWATGRRDGIEWPAYEDGSVSLSLGDLAAANGIEDHAATAHDALADVRATIELARLLRRTQPKLWEYAFGLRRKKAVSNVVDAAGSPFLLCDRGIGAARGHATIAVTIDQLDSNGRLVLDLHGDPAEILELEPRQLHARFHRLDPDLPRVPVRRVRTNKLPMVTEEKWLKALDPEVWAAIGLDQELVDSRMAFVRENHVRIRECLRLVADEPPETEHVDPEELLYAGFPADGDSYAMRTARDGGPEALRRFSRTAGDERLAELAFRYLARTHPDALDAEERARWTLHLRDRLLAPGDGETSRGLDSLTAIQAVRDEGADPRIADEVEAWTRGLAKAVDVELPAGT